MERLGGQPREMPAKPAPNSASAIVRALVAQFTDETRRRCEVAALEAALAAAHGELLELRGRAATSGATSA